MPVATCMKTSAKPKQMIEVERLRVGMFVHLDMSWMAHPFPLGNFKIANAEQIATIRSLGLAQVRWNPAQSDVGPERHGNLLPEALAESTSAPGVGAGPGAAGAEVGSHATVSDLAVDVAAAAYPVDCEPAAPEPAASMRVLEAGEAAAPLPAAAAPTRSAEVLARRAHRRALVEQRDALQLCERQFAEAARDLRQVTDLAMARPADARAGAEQLATALVDKLIGERELCIRLLNDAAGDKASAHALNVAVISLLMGRTFGFSADELLDLGVGALLHDVGKLQLPERLRHCEEQSSAAELGCYEEHVAHGVAHARRMGLSAGAALVIAQHHEHADGSGFPLRLNSDRMTAAGRIVALVNRYDNLCNPGNPARALTPHESISLLFSQGKTKFDTAILGAFIRMMGVYPAGSTVQLTDDRYAMVVGVNSTRPLKPRVVVHEPQVPRDEALIVDLERSHGLGIRRSIKPAQLPPGALRYLAPRTRVAYFFEAVDTASEPALAA